MPDSHSSGLGTILLLVGLALLIAAAGVVAFYPLLRCPDCDLPTFLLPERCIRCKDRRQITLLDRWRKGDPRIPDWEGKEISMITGVGFIRTNQTRALSLSGLRLVDGLTAKKRDAAIQAIWETGDYLDIDVNVSPDLQSPGKVAVRILATEK